ncbi:alpha-2 adrenergic receptor [Trichonephila clavipes]|nr:alpha-2 adrenergic receptor [Trichonephila clavipes]
MKIGNIGNLVLGPFDESTPCLIIVLMNCQTKLRINHLTAVKSVAILEMSQKAYDRINAIEVDVSEALANASMKKAVPLKKKLLMAP